MSTEKPDNTSTTPKQWQVPTKRYYSNMPFTTIHVMVGPAQCEAFCFVNHQLDTDHKLVQETVEPLIDRPGSGIVSVGRDQIALMVNQAAQDARQSAEKAHAKAIAAGLPTA